MKAQDPIEKQVEYIHFDCKHTFRDGPMPQVGDRVNVNVNGLGPAKVTGYFIEHGFMGICVDVENPPEWALKQNGPGATYHVFGNELRTTPPPPLSEIVEQAGYNLSDIDRIVRAETAFLGFADMLGAKGNYRPSISVDTEDRARLANAYDATQVALNDNRRAFRYGAPGSHRYAGW